MGETMMRREFLQGTLGVAGALALSKAASGVDANAAVITHMPSKVGDGAAIDVKEFHRMRRFADLPMGRIAYVERGRGPVALFLHGFPLNGYQWRGALERLSKYRRCIAADFMGLGYTET